jgi:hypothetical protein
LFKVVQRKHTISKFLSTTKQDLAMLVVWQLQMVNISQHQSLENGHQRHCRVHHGRRYSLGHITI